jgi:cytochrome c biogenesis protein CcdA
MKKSIFIILLVILSLVGAFLFLEKVPLNVYPGDIMFLPVLIASSLVDSINPCAFSVLLISIAFLASLGASRKKMIVLGLSYIFGIFAVYLFIGLGLLRVLDFFGIPNFMGKVGATILLLFGLSNVLSYIFPNFPIEFKIPKSAHSKMAVFMGKASFVGSFILGALVALFEFPCTGGPYLLILGLGHDGEVNTGSLYWGGAVPTTILDRYGVDSRALHYNRGANIQVPYTAAINPSTMTLSCWFNIDVSSPLRDNQYLISLNRSAGFQVVYRSNQTVNMSLNLAETPGTKVTGDAGVTMTPGTWYHLVITFGDGHLRFYVNGALTRDITQTGTIIKNGAVDLCFGQDIPTASYGLTPSDPNYVGDGGYLSGSLDEVRIYKTVLSPAQISAIYSLEKP